MKVGKLRILGFLPMPLDVGIGHVSANPMYVREHVLLPHGV